MALWSADGLACRSPRRRALADDLAALGITYRRGVGYSRHRAHVDPDTVARFAADALDSAAAAIDGTAATAEALALDLVDLGADRHDAVYANLRDALDAPEIRDTPRALRATTDDLRLSAAARRALLSIVREHLPSGADRDAADAAAWLTRFDSHRLVDRATLGRIYLADGSPGGLTRQGLYSLAADRVARRTAPGSRRARLAGVAK